MKNSELVRKVISALLTVGGRHSSPRYIELVVQTVLEKNKEKQKVFQHIAVSPLQVHYAIDDMSNDEVRDAINVLLHSIVSTSQKQGARDQFYMQLAGELGHATTLHLVARGIDIPEAK